MNPILTILCRFGSIESTMFLSVSSVLMVQNGSNRDQTAHKGSKLSVLGSTTCTPTCVDPQSTFVETDEKKGKKWPKIKCSKSDQK